MKFKLFFKHIYNEYMEDELGSLAAQTSYFLLLAFIPFLIFILTIIGSLKIPTADIYSSLRSILPTQSFNIVSGILSEVLQTNSINITSLFLTFYFATRGVRAIVVALNKSYCEVENRNVLQIWFISIIFTLILSFILILSLLSLVFGKLIGQIISTYIHIEFGTLWFFLRYLVTILFIIIAFCIIYKHAPNCKQLKYKNIIVGSIFTTLSWTITSLIFAYYVNNYNSSYISLYGSLAGIFALLIWLYISSIIIILGGEINAYLYKNSSFGRFR